jgi:hypothetical protein
MRPVTAFATTSCTPSIDVIARSTSHAQAAQRIASVSSEISLTPSTATTCSASTSGCIHSAKSRSAPRARGAGWLRTR